MVSLGCPERGSFHATYDFCSDYRDSTFEQQLKRSSAIDQTRTDRLTCFGVPCSERHARCAHYRRELHCPKSPRLDLMVWGNRGFDPNLQGSRFTHWETWLSEQEVFAPPGVTLARNAAGRVLLPLSRPRQFNHFIGKGTRTAALQSAVGPRGSTDFRRANENRLRLGNSKRRQMIAHSARVARKKRSVDTRIIFLYTAPVPAHLKSGFRAGRCGREAAPAAWVSEPASREALANGVLPMPARGAKPARVDEDRMPSNPPVRQYDR